MVFSFKKQLDIGKDAEARFHLKFPKLELISDKKGPDFKYKDTFIELKTDKYDYMKTGNFFMEQYSAIETGKVGGPWQALLKGSTVFCYMFSKYNHLFVFNTAALVDYLNEHINTYRSVDVKNVGYTTVGLLVPIKGLEALYRFYDLNKKKVSEKIFLEV